MTLMQSKKKIAMVSDEKQKLLLTQKYRNKKLSNHIISKENNMKKNLLNITQIIHTFQTQAQIPNLSNRDTHETLNKICSDSQICPPLNKLPHITL